MLQKSGEKLNKGHLLLTEYLTLNHCINQYVSGFQASLKLFKIIKKHNLIQQFYILGVSIWVGFMQSTCQPLNAL